MKTIEFQFSVQLFTEAKTYDISFPFDNVLVYGGRFCTIRFSQEPDECPFH